jgi:hypothetical protein
VGVIEESLDQLGFYGAIMLQRSTRLILAGNHRYRVACAKGAPTIPGFWLDLDDDQAARLMAGDNEAGRRGTYDKAKLLALLQPLVMTETGLPPGFKMATVDDLLAELHPEPPDEPDFPPPSTGSNDESDPDRADRLRGPGGQSMESRGIRDVILVLPNADADQLAEHIKALRGLWGDLTQGEVVLRACAQAVEDSNQVGQP